MRVNGSTQPRALNVFNHIRRLNKKNDIYARGKSVTSFISKYRKYLEVLWKYDEVQFILPRIESLLTEEDIWSSIRYEFII